MKKKPGWKLRKAEKEIAELKREVERAQALTRTNLTDLAFVQTQNQSLAQRVEKWRLEAEGRKGALMRIVQGLNITPEQIVTLLMPANPYYRRIETSADATQEVQVELK